MVWKSYQDFRRNRDAVHEFEVELNLNQIEEVVDDGIYIKVHSLVSDKKDLFLYQIFKSNMEKGKVKVFLRETSSTMYIIKIQQKKSLYERVKL